MDVTIFSILLVITFLVGAYYVFSKNYAALFFFGLLLIIVGADLYSIGLLEPTGQTYTNDVNGFRVASATAYTSHLKTDDVAIGLMAYGFPGIGSIIVFVSLLKGLESLLAGLDPAKPRGSNF